MNERRLKILIIFTVLCGVLFNYQNCGSKNATSSAEPIQLVDDGEMDIIDPMSTGGIQFVQSKAEVTTADTELAASGICSAEQNGSLLSWKVFNSNLEIVAQGKSLCDKGTFEIVFEGVESLACDTELSLQAFFGAKAKTQLLISKNCQ